MNSQLVADVIVVGAGHNGLIAALLLARAGLQVVVVEAESRVGGAAKTEYPFRKAPLLGTSSGAYLLGVMPPELLTKLGIHLPLIVRDPHYFLPTLDKRYLLLGSDEQEARRQILEFFSEADWRAYTAFRTEIEQIRDDLAPSWLEEPQSAEATAERYIRPALRQTFLELIQRPVEEYLYRFGFKSELLLAMYAVTDAFSGLNASFGTPGAGFNFLVHNMCRLPGSNGAFMMVSGGMGTISRELSAAAAQAGARILTQAAVARIEVEGGVASGVLLKDGRRLRARTVVCNADPFKLLTLVGPDGFPTEFVKRVESMKRDGTTLKVNLALRGLPRFTCLPENRGQYSTTIHLLPQTAETADGGSIIDRIRRGFQKVQGGELDDCPTIEWYIHTEADPSLRDQKGHHNSAFFVQWVPYELKGTTWEQQEELYVKRLLAIADQFAPGTSELVVDTFTLTPPKIERHFGISRGHIHHVDNTLGFDQRMPYSTPIPGLYSCSAGCHPAGSVIGAAGHNAARRILKDLDCATTA
jgi:phytoene dehydrogenase-like protein